jgi:hypothetical protein
MNPQEQNFIAELMTEGENILNLRSRLRLLQGRYSANNFSNSITDGEFSAIPALSHLTADEMRRAMAVIDAIVSLVDSNIVVGGNTDIAANHLLRLKG